MTNPRQKFQQTLKDALDNYHPDWDVRRRGTWDERHHAEWERNRQFSVWVDTLKRWVRGDHFPRVKTFERFLESC